VQTNFLLMYCCSYVTCNMFSFKVVFFTIKSPIWSYQLCNNPKIVLKILIVALYLHFFQRKGVFIPLMESRLIKFYNNHFMLSDKDCCLYRFCHVTMWTICTARIRFVKRMGLTWQRLPCWHMNLRYFVSSTSFPIPWIEQSVNLGEKYLLSYPGSCVRQGYTRLFPQNCFPLLK